MEAHVGLQAAYDGVKQAMRMETDVPSRCARRLSPAGTAVRYRLPGVYGGFMDKFPIGSLMNRSLTIKTRTDACAALYAPLLDRIVERCIDPSFVVTHHMTARSRAARLRHLQEQRDECIKVVLKP